MHAHQNDDVFNIPTYIENTLYCRGVVVGSAKCILYKQCMNGHTNICIVRKKTVAEFIPYLSSCFIKSTRVKVFVF